MSIAEVARIGYDRGGVFGYNGGMSDGLYISLLAIDLIYFILLLFSLYAAARPEKIVEFTVDKSLRQMKFYAFEAAITPTKRSVSVIRNGHLLVALVLIVLLAIINYALFF